LYLTRLKKLIKPTLIAETYKKYCILKLNLLADKIKAF